MEKYQRERKKNKLRIWEHGFPKAISRHHMDVQLTCQSRREPMDYQKEHPEVTVLDPPDAIKLLFNRQFMLREVADLNLSDSHGKVCVPRQMVVTRDPLSIPHEVNKAGWKLPLVNKEAGVFRFPRVSSSAASADDADLDPSIGEFPPRPLLERLSKELRLRLGLQLFNIDMIREHGTRDVFYVIDINYFPGFEKMPDYEHIFTDFLLSLGQSKYRKSSAT